LTKPPCLHPAKKSWRGCGSHIPGVLDSVPENERCTCEPRVKVGDKEYPPAAAMQVPGMAWLGGLFGGGKGGEAGGQGQGKGKEEL
jgi:hypothetical protein